MPVELRKRKTPPPQPPKPAKKKAAPKSTAAKAKDAVVEQVEKVAPGVAEAINGEEKPKEQPEEKPTEIEAPAAAEEAKPEASTTSAEPLPLAEPEPAPVPAPAEATTSASEPAAASSSGLMAGGVPKVGESVNLDTFGGEIETNDGNKTTVKKLLDESKAGIILFTYPKASTPGCTKQACLFRDAYDSLTSTGLSIYGLSNDSPKANTTFKTKQNLQYPLLCDPKQTLIKAIGMGKAPKSTKRGVFVINKEGKVLVAEEGGPDATVQAVKKIVEGAAGDVEMKDADAQKVNEEVEAAKLG